MKIIVTIKDMGNGITFETKGKGFKKANINERFYSNVLNRLIVGLIENLKGSLSGLPDVDGVLRALGEDEDINV